jgi:hypothetical protein
LKLQGRFAGDLILRLVEPSPKALDSRHSYVIDSGLQIFQWNGRQAVIVDRSKGRYFAERICRHDRPTGKAFFTELQEGLEPAKLWQVFGGETRKPGTF